MKIAGGGYRTREDFFRMAADASKGDKSTPASHAGVSNKFNAQKVSNADGNFDSKHESRMAVELLRLQAGGYIKDVTTDRRDFCYEIKVNNCWIAKYTADAKFTCVKPVELDTHDGVRRLVPGEEYVVDAKSSVTRKKRDYLLVKNLMYAVHDIKILEL